MIHSMGCLWPPDAASIARSVQPALRPADCSALERAHGKRAISNLMERLVFNVRPIQHMLCESQVQQHLPGDTVDTRRGLRSLRQLPLQNSSSLDVAPGQVFQGRCRVIKPLIIDESGTATTYGVPEPDAFLCRAAHPWPAGAPQVRALFYCQHIEV